MSWIGIKSHPGSPPTLNSSSSRIGARSPWRTTPRAREDELGPPMKDMAN